MVGKTLLAVYAGKLTARASRLTGRGGTTLPGRVARRLDPGILRHLAAQPRRGVVMVTGTNGKTTTSRMLSHVLARQGWHIVHNRQGANLLMGLTAAFVAAADPLGRIRADLALLEVDEATVPLAAPEVRPRILLVTNFFRDQLDRYGELATTVSLVEQGLASLAPKGIAVLNADDPLVAALGAASDRPPLYYGVEAALPAETADASPLDITTCLRCGTRLEYSQRFYAHLGRYTCPGCGLTRPDPQVRLSGYRPSGDGADLEITGRKGVYRFRLPLPGLYNAINALAAVAAGETLGLSSTALCALQDFTTGFGRMQKIPVGARHLALALVKNPTGFNQVLQTIARDEGPKGILFVINDRHADGTDVSWLWDVDLESVAQAAGDRLPVWASGIRAEDMAVRLKYAGFPPERIGLVREPEEAITRGLEGVAEGGTLYLLPTYTALLGVTEILAKRGLGKQFWRE